MEISGNNQLIFNFLHTSKVVSIMRLSVLVILVAFLIFKPPTADTKKPVALVIGAGPVGLAGALRLSHMNFSVTIVESRSSEKFASRKQYLDINPDCSFIVF